MFRLVRNFDEIADIAAVEILMNMKASGFTAFSPYLDNLQTIGDDIGEKILNIVDNANLTYLNEYFVDICKDTSGEFNIVCGRDWMPISKFSSIVIGKIMMYIALLK